MIELPPFDGWMFATAYTLREGFRHMWILLVNRVPPGALAAAALALMAYWLWTLCKCMPGLAYVIAAYSA